MACNSWCSRLKGRRSWRVRVGPLGSTSLMALEGKGNVEKGALDNNRRANKTGSGCSFRSCLRLEKEGAGLLRELAPLGLDAAPSHHTLGRTQAGEKTLECLVNAKTCLAGKIIPKPDCSEHKAPMVQLQLGALSPNLRVVWMRKLRADNPVHP